MSSKQDTILHGLALFVEACGIACAIGVLSRAWWRHTHSQHQRDNVATVALMPAYVTLMRLFTVTSVAQAVVAMIAESPGLIATAFNSAVLHGQALFMLQRGAGQLTLRRTLQYCLVALLIEVLVTIAQPLQTDPANAAAAASYTCWQVLLTVAYLLLWLLPSRVLFRRPAAPKYGRFWACCHLVLACSALPICDWLSTVYSKVGFIVGKGLMYSCCGPFVLYAAMREDSAFWQGHQQQADAHTPLLGVTYSANNAAELADAIEHAQQQSGVTLLNFAALRIRADELLGAGGQARVYVGVLSGAKVAVKVVFCMDLTSEIIQEFCAEAAFLTGLVHPNVVRVHGICVVPPTLGLVLELCERGSLTSVLADRAQDWTWKQKIAWCCDCARSIEFLHSCGIVHRDLKSGNFLVSADRTTKLADFGLAQLSTTGPAADREIRSRRSRLGASGNGSLFSVTSRFSQQSAGSSIYTTVTASASFCGTVAWAAPEVLLGSKYSEAADIFSLGVVLWEIAAQQLPYSTGAVSQLGAQALISAVAGRGDWRSLQPLQVHDAETYVAGLRPAFPVNVPSGFVDIVCQCWHHNQLHRPTARDVLAHLQRLSQDAAEDTVHSPHWAASATTVQPVQQAPSSIRSTASFEVQSPMLHQAS